MQLALTSESFIGVFIHFFGSTFYLRLRAVFSAFSGWCFVCVLLSFFIGFSSAFTYGLPALSFAFFGRKTLYRLAPALKRDRHSTFVFIRILQRQNRFYNAFGYRSQPFRRNAKQSPLNPLLKNTERGIYPKKETSFSRLTILYYKRLKNSSLPRNFFYILINFFTLSNFIYIPSAKRKTKSPKKAVFALRPFFIYKNALLNAIKILCQT